MTRFPRLLLRFFWLLLLLMALASLVGWWLVRGSLAQLDGKLELAGLTAPVRIERDALGVVSIHAGNEADAARALGYVHGQERYFEMDLLAPFRRRRAVGTVRRDRHREGQVDPRASAARTRRAKPRSDRRRKDAGTECLHRRRQCGPRHASRAALALPAAWRAAEGVDASRLACWPATRCSSTCRTRPTRANWRSGKSGR